MSPSFFAPKSQATSRSSTLYNPQTMEPQVQFATTRDGVRIACAAFGAGPPLVRVSQTRWDYFHAWYAAVGPYRAMVDQFAEQRTLITYDARGTGLSQRDAINYTLEAQILDLEAVINHFHLNEFALLGWQMGSPAAITAAWRWQESVSGLVLVNPVANGKEFLNLPEIRARASYRRIGESVWHEYRTVQAGAIIHSDDTDLLHRVVDVMGRAVSPEVIRIHAEEHGSIDVMALLPELAMPAFCVISQASPWNRLSRAAARAIPNSRTLLIEGANVLWLPAEATAEVLSFLGQPSAGATVQAVRLSPREFEVLRLVASGCSNLEIAQRLGLSENTVLHHISNLLRKLSARNRAHAVALGYRSGLLS